LRFTSEATILFLQLQPSTRRYYAFCWLLLYDQSRSLSFQRFSTARSFPAQHEEISRGKTLNFPRVDAQFIKRKPNADGRLNGHVPTGLTYVTPNIGFLSIVPRFRFGLPSAISSRK